MEVDSETQDEGSQSLLSTKYLPGDEATWNACQLGAASKWPHSLQALSLSIALFSYPAAIYWSPQLVLVHNEAWRDAGGIGKQGQVQRGQLPPDVWSSLSASLRGGKPRKVHSQQLLRERQESNEKYTVLLSPLFSDDGGDAAGVLAQLIPVLDAREQELLAKSDTGSRSSISQWRELNELGDAVDSLPLGPPLDEHPFFHRFAEMLPTGLAILDHKARAIFVNQHFYELTTHEEDDKSFKAWPQSIHPDDYERVMSTYQEAFRSQKQVRTEFRSLGHRCPWRLLLLTPLGDENLQHVSSASSCSSSSHNREAAFGFRYPNFPSQDHSIGLASIHFRRRPGGKGAMFQHYHSTEGSCVVQTNGTNFFNRSVYESTVASSAALWISPLRRARSLQNVARQKKPARERSNRSASSI